MRQYWLRWSHPNLRKDVNVSYSKESHLLFHILVNSTEEICTFQHKLSGSQTFSARDLFDLKIQ